MNEVLTYDALLNLPNVVQSRAEANEGLIDELSEKIYNKYYYEGLKEDIDSNFDKFRESMFFYKFPLKYELSASSGSNIIAGHKKNGSISRIEKMVDDAIDNEIWLKKFYNCVVDLGDKLTVFEATYFVDTFFAGHTQVEVAGKLGITRQTLRRIMKSCLVKAYLEFRYLNEE